MNVDINDDTPPPYSLIANSATQFLGGNLLGNSLGIVYTCNSVCIEQYRIKYLNLEYMHVF